MDDDEMEYVEVLEVDGNAEPSGVMKSTMEDDPYWFLKEDQEYRVIERKTSGFAIASLICSIVGLFGMGLIMGVLGIVFGFIALGRIDDEPRFYSGKGLAVAGIIIGIISIIGAILAILVIMSM
ncbi:MAG: DUF4190 domain-containing protein [Thermoplasmatota archaeon]